MHRIFSAALIAAALLTTSAPAAAAMKLIDFNTVQVNNVASLTFGTVTFSAIGGGLTTTYPGNHPGFALAPNGTPALISFNPTTNKFSALQAVFSVPTNFVSVDIGGYEGVELGLFVSAYDAGGDYIGGAFEILPYGVTAMRTLSFSRPGIASVIFGGYNPATLYSGLTDNFVYQTSVPEPASWAMLVTGFGLVGGALRRRGTTRQSNPAIA